VHGRSTTGVGVMPVGFDFPLQAAIWKPLALAPEDWDERQARYLTPLGRLARGASLAAAQAELGAVARTLAREWPRTNAGREALVLPLVRGVVDPYSPIFIQLLMGTAAFVLLIVCTNLAGLLLARGTGRAKEIAIRAALGASRARVIRQLLTESLALAVAGAMLGVWVAAW